MQFYTWTHTQAPPAAAGRSGWWVIAFLLTIAVLGLVAWLAATGRLPFGVG